MFYMFKGKPGLFSSYSGKLNEHEEIHVNGSELENACNSEILEQRFYELRRIKDIPFQMNHKTSIL